MNLHPMQVVEVYTTPTELRRMADIMERNFKNAKLGGDNPAYDVYHRAELTGNITILRFKMDQEEYHREQRSTYGS